MEHVSGIVRDILARLEKDAIFQTEGEPDGRPYLMEKKRPLLEILDEIESRISPEIRELEVRDGEIVRKENPQILRRNKDRSFWVDEEMTYHEDDKDDDEPDWEEVLDEE